MNYPIWETTRFGGGSWIALIAILHVYISHLAVGGGLFIWLTDRKAWRENNPQLHDYLRRHTWFFLYLTMVFGGVSGVGIWFIIALVNPTGTSLLIHNFVFGWAIEWVFFLGEITALLLYAYRFPHLDRKGRQILAFFYALFAWLSLFIINGILSFMLTPGRWADTHYFWHGFLNPTFFPSLIFRTAMAVMIAGLFGLVTAVRCGEAGFRNQLVRYCSRWLLLPVPLAIVAGAWYWAAIPEATRLAGFGQNRDTWFFIKVFAAASGALFVLGVAVALSSGRFFQRVATVLVAAIGLSWIGGFEYIREIVRKPYLITGELYANSLPVFGQAGIDRFGLLPRARWSEIKSVTADHQKEAGRELFNLQCLGCHTIGGGRNDILRATRPLSYQGILSQLTGQGRLLRYMPPVLGTAEEKAALAVYLADLGGKEIRREPEPAAIKPAPTAVPARVEAREKHLLLAWNDLGFHWISDSDPWFVLSPPGNTLEAQLIKCGLTPEILGQGYELTYRVEPGFENPAAQVPFWDHAPATFKQKLEKNTGLSGSQLAGKFTFDAARKSFVAKMIPVTPYPEGGGYQPYPLFTVEARDTKTGILLAAVKTVAPVSTELGCRNCHGGGWRVASAAGLGTETATNILAAHDRINHTKLYQDALAGQPRRCTDCHASPGQNAPGQPGILNLSAAMHGWHANYLSAAGASSCALCHPSAEDSRTRCYRGLHRLAGMDCTACHGALADHALSLLKGQADLPAARALQKHLVPVAVSAPAEVKPRTPWVNEPDCLACHEKFEPPKKGASAFNRWTKDPAGLYRNKVDEAGLHCIACHGSTHAEYPALNPYHPLRDNLQPLMYSGQPFAVGSEASCEICHLEKMESPIHHDNMMQPFRHKEAWHKAVSGAGLGNSAK